MRSPLDELTLDQLRTRTSIKWRQFEPQVLPLWVAEMDVTLAEPIAAALHAAIDRHDTGYPLPTTYAPAMAEFAAARWGWKVDPERTAIVADVMRGIVEMIRLVSAPGDAVVVNSPVYAPFYLFVGSAERRVVEAPLSAEYRIDLGVLERVFAHERPAVYLLCSPHNPTGTVHSRDELDGVIRLAEEYAVRVVVDEIHAPLVYADRPHLPFLTLPGAERSFVLVSATKAWNLPGLKAALAVAGDRAVDDLRRLPPEISDGATHFGVIAQRAAWLEGTPWLDAVLAGLDRNRVLLADLVGEHLQGVRYRPSEATYLAWLDVRELGLGRDPAQRFLEVGVALNEGHVFGTGGAGHVRLNFATSPDILTQAVERMATVVTRGR